jgi:hypothetical protein
MSPKACDALAAAFADIACKPESGSQGARYLDPATGFVSLTVSGGDLAVPKTASTSTIAGGSAELVVDGLSAGAEYVISVLALDGPGGTTLSSASKTVRLSAGVNSQALGLLPFSSTPVQAGPVPHDWSGSAGETAVFRIPVPVATGYVVRATTDGADPIAIYGLYGPDGARVSGFANTPGAGTFTATVTGDYYAAVRWPDGASVVNISVDIPISFAIGGNVSVSESFSVRDAALPVRVSCDRPIASVIGLAGWDAGATAAVSGSVVTVTPSGTWAYTAGANPTPVQITLVDGVIGVERTVSLDLPPRKRFVYVRNGGTSTTVGSLADPCGKLSWAAQITRTYADSQVAIVLLAGTDVTETADMDTLGIDAAIVGGCVDAGDHWEKAPDGRGRSTVRYPVGNYAIMNGLSSATTVSSVDFVRAAFTSAVQYPLLDIMSSSPVIRDCSFVSDGFSCGASSLDWALVRADASSAPFIRSTKIRVGPVALSGAIGGNFTLYALRADAGLALVSSVVSCDVMSWTGVPSTSPSMGFFGVGVQTGAAGPTYIVGSTIRAGRRNPSQSPEGTATTFSTALRISNGNGNTWIYDSIFLSDDDAGASYDYRVPLFSSAMNPISAIENSSFTTVSFCMYFAGTPVGPGDLNSGGGRLNNVAYSNTEHGFAGYAAGDFRLTASSPAVLRTGGLVDPTAPPAQVRVALAYDVSLAARSADAAWSIGAYEY